MTTEELKSIDWRDIRNMNYDELITTYRQAASRGNLLLGNLRRYAPDSPAYKSALEQIGGTFKWKDLNSSNMDELRRRTYYAVQFLGFSTNTSRKFREFQEATRRRIFDDESNFSESGWKSFWEIYGILEKLGAWADDKDKDSGRLQKMVREFIGKKKIADGANENDIYDAFREFLEQNDQLSDYEKMLKFFPKRKTEETFGGFTDDDTGNEPGGAFDTDSVDEDDLPLLFRI